MSQENVEIVRRVSDAYNRRDLGAMLDELHPEIEWHPWLQLQLGGAATVYRGTKASARESENLKKPSLKSRQSKQRSGSASISTQESPRSRRAAGVVRSALEARDLDWQVGALARHQFRSAGSLANSQTSRPVVRFSR